MKKNIHTDLPQIIFGSPDSAVSRRINQLEKSGNIRKIAPRLYTSNLKDSPKDIVKRNLFTVLGGLFEGAVLSHRSALEFQPTETDDIFVTYKYTRKTKLAGITVNFLKGQGAIAGDNLLADGLFAAQKERALLENLQISRRKGGASKTLPRTYVEEELDKIIRVHGETGLNELRDKAKAISEQLEMTREYEKLHKMISAMLATRPSKLLHSSVAKARALGTPYDPARVDLFQKLFIELQQNEYKNQPERNQTDVQFRLFAFYESYFSNYIEGTRFGLAEARNIIQNQQPLPARQEDSHDILGTYRIASDVAEMSLTPTSADELLEILMRRHHVLLSARTSKNPGKFKDKNNYAGQTAFVDYTLVRGTLIKGFELYRALNAPFAKAAFMMFLVSEVHPFLDGNGRIARIMMNAELTANQQSKIIIPTVFRDDYLLALRRLTRQHDPKPYITMLQVAYEFSAELFYTENTDFQEHLRQTNAFLEHTEGRLKVIENLKYAR